MSVTGFVSVSPDQLQKSTGKGEEGGFELNAKGEYGVEVTITDAATGRVLGKDTVWSKPGLPRSHVFAFTKPICLPEGATVKYSLLARAKSGKGWAASGTAQIWTTKPAYEGGFEPVILPIEASLRAED